MIVQQLFLLSILLYVAGAIASLALSRFGKAANRVSAISTLAAASAGLGSAIAVLARGTTFATELPGMIPFARFAIEVDLLSGFVLLVISLLAGATAVYALSYGAQHGAQDAGVLGFLNNIFIVSMILVVASANAFYFLVFWELMTLASYFLVVSNQDEEAISSGFVYFAVAHAAAAAIVALFVVLYLHSGSFDFAAFRSATMAPAVKNLVFFLAFIGFGAKAGVVPVHFWLPRAHPAAPSTVSALMSGVMVKVAVYGLLRVGVDLLGAPVWWWGLTVLVFGAISAVVGMLYAPGERDLKRMLAYSTVENVGIILMGTGVGMIGLGTGNPALGVLGIVAALYHLLNHALFKGLLFLAAGSVTHEVGTRNMEEMGGLAKQMPWTGATFLTAALAASAIPPFNGFVSEWFTYQSLFHASSSSILAVKVLAPLTLVMLAIAGALAALCFVRAYGVVFSGPRRTGDARKVREVPVPMVAGMSVLAAGCIVLGLGAPVIAPRVGDVAMALAKSAPVQLSDGMRVLASGDPHAVLSTPLIALLLVGFVTIPLIIVALQGGMQAGRRIDSEPWAAGYQYSPRMAYTATAFSEPLRVLFRPVYRAMDSLERPGEWVRSYFKGAVAHLADVESVWERHVYAPLACGVTALGKQMQRLENGNVRLYCAFIIVTLITLLLATVR